MPLQNFSASKAETDYVVDGMTEALIAELAKNRFLRVVSRTTAMRFKDAKMPLREIAAELGVTESRVCQLRAQALARLRRSPMLEFANE